VGLVKLTGDVGKQQVTSGTGAAIVKQISLYLHKKKSTAA